MRIREDGRLLLSNSEFRALLLDTIRRQGGAWTPGRVKRLCAKYNLSHILRATIRRHLAALEAEGHLVRHETPGRRYYLPATGGDQ